MVKELAARDGLLATFMGKPFNDDEGSGFHIHVSFEDSDGANVCERADDVHGLSPLTRHFIAGVLEHGPAMMVFFNPTVNAYRRISAARSIWSSGLMQLRSPHRIRGPVTPAIMRADEIN